MIFTNHVSLAQNDSLASTKLPFNSYLTHVKDFDSSTIENYSDSLVILDRIEKLDTAKLWRLIALTVDDSMSGDVFPEWLPENNKYKSNGTCPFINSNTLNKYFDLNVRGIGKFTNWNNYDLSIDWTPFRYGKYLVIKKCDRSIGSLVNSETVYTYYFEEVK